MNIVKFDRTSFNLTGLSSNTISEPKIQETSTLTIIKCAQGKIKDTNNCSEDPKNQEELKARLQLRVNVWNKYKESGKIWMFDNDVLNGVDAHLNHNYHYDMKNYM